MKAFPQFKRKSWVGLQFKNQQGYPSQAAPKGLNYPTAQHNGQLLPLSCSVCCSSLPDSLSLSPSPRRRFVFSWRLIWRRLQNWLETGQLRRCGWWWGSVLSSLMKSPQRTEILFPLSPLSLGLVMKSPFISKTKKPGLYHPNVQYISLKYENFACFSYLLWNFPIGFWVFVVVMSATN